MIKGIYPNQAPWTRQRLIQPRGTTTATLAISIAGIQATSSQGALTTTVVNTLAGIQAASSQGAVTTTAVITLAGIQATSSQGTVTTSSTRTIAGIQAASSQGAVTASVAKAIAGIQATTGQGAITTSSTRTIAGIQATTGQGVVAIVGPIVVTRRPRHHLLRPIIDVRVIVEGSRVVIRSGRARVNKTDAINIKAYVLPLYKSVIRSAVVTLVKTPIDTKAVSKAGIPAAIYWEKEAKISATSRAHTTSRVVTVLSGMPSVSIITVAYPDGSLIPIRSGDVSYIYTTRYS